MKLKSCNLQEIQFFFSQIKFVYDDDTTWCYGWSDGGREDNRHAVMTEGEYLTRITHETFVNYRCAAAGVEFETNKGRIFSYQPLGMSTNWKRLVMSILIRYPQLSCIF